MDASDVISYEALWEAGLKCQKGVRWKPSTKHFIINAPEDVLKMCEKLRKGEWKSGKPKAIKILYPKKRDGLSIAFRDRVYQRSINDNVLYPEMARHFIMDNAACQTGKGTSFARERLKKFLWNYFTKYGSKGYILQVDIHGYYPNMRHDVVKSHFRKHINKNVYDMTSEVLDTQYAGEIGYNPGSQMVQIAGISVLNDVDHYIKERLHTRYYIRYMDDLTIIHHDRQALEDALTEITKQLNAKGFEINQKKTAIKTIKGGFRFLGFDYHVTDTGKIIMTVNPESVKHERKKLYRMVQKCKRGEMDKSKADECYAGWKAYASIGNSYKIMKRMDTYYKSLWEGIK